MALPNFSECSHILFHLTIHHPSTLVGMYAPLYVMAHHTSTPTPPKFTV
jgi:hypothetical protein